MSLNTRVTLLMIGGVVLFGVNLFKLMDKSLAEIKFFDLYMFGWGILSVGYAIYLKNQGHKK